MSVFKLETPKDAYEDKNPKSCTEQTILWIKKYTMSILAEFLSTTILILFGCMTCLPSSGSEAPPLANMAFGFGLIVMFNMQTFGHISGAHMNPAVSIATYIWGQKTLPICIAYILAQCSGSLFGYYLLVLLAGDFIKDGGLCVTIPSSEINIYQAIGVEFSLTAILCLICCSLWDHQLKGVKDNLLKIEFTVIVLIFAGSELTGASMNPARSLGPAIISGIWTDHYVYWIGPIAGAIFATFLYKYVLRIY